MIGDLLMKVGRGCRQGMEGMAAGWHAAWLRSRDGERV